MSQHPLNPWWSQQTDQPIMPTSHADWDQALKGQFITQEHVRTRLEAIIGRALGLDAYSGYDVDGFHVSLIAAGVQVGHGITLRVHSNDHEPPHAHVRLPGSSSDQLKVDIMTGDLSGVIPGNLSRAQRQAITLGVRNNSVKLGALWSQVRQART